MKYTSKELVLLKLPGNIPSSFSSSLIGKSDEEVLDLWYTEIERIIEDNSSYVSEYLGKTYANIDDVLKTPKSIEQICRWLSIAEADIYFGGVAKGNEEGENESYYRKLAMTELKRLDANSNFKSNLAVGSFAGRNKVYNPSDLEQF